MTHLNGSVIRNNRYLSPDGNDLAASMLFGLANAGRTMQGGIGPVSTPNGQTFKLELSNPVDSGRSLNIERLRVFADTVDEFLELRVNATAGKPSTLLSAVPGKLSAPAGLGLLKYDVNATAMTGGVVQQWKLPFTRGSLYEFDALGTRIVPPGVSVGVQMSNTSGSSSNIVIVVDWIELDL